MHESTNNVVRSFVGKYLTELPTLRVADVGSFDVNGTYRPLFQRPGWEYVGLDLRPGKNVDVVLPHEFLGWEFTWSFDVVVCGQALEHTRRPHRVVEAIAGILKPGGFVCLVAPYQWEYHAEPIDCWRIYPEAMRALLGDAGFTVLEVYHTGDLSSPGDTVGVGRKPL